MDQENRIVVLIDMDCFYCQVEEKLNPQLKGKPIAVVQYNPWRGGGIIAVNYVARAMGVTRHMRGNEAKQKCPEIQLPSVPCFRGKADITKYREAGKDVAKVLQRFTPLLERASIDEAYLDITDPVRKRILNIDVGDINSNMLPNNFALGYDTLDSFISDVHSCGLSSMEFDYEHSKHLLVGALIVSEIRAAVYAETGYQCSAGIAHNKILAKLVCGMNKPNKQTVLPKHSVNILYKTLSLKKVKHLGGKFGDHVAETLNISTMGQLQTFTEKDLQARFDEKNGSWLYNIARGVDLEPVQARFNPKSIGCCKQLRGKAALQDLVSLRKWLRDLGDEIENRLEQDSLENSRIPKQMVVSFSLQASKGKRDISSSRSYNFSPEDELCGEIFSSKALELVMDSAEGCKPTDGELNRMLKAPITFLGISVGKFDDNIDAKKTKKIKDYFSAGSSKDVSQTDESVRIKPERCVEKDGTNAGKEYVLEKYFESSDDVRKENITSKISTETEQRKETVYQSSLDRQESFFAKYLNSGRSNVANDRTPCTRAATPVCNVECNAEASNDTDYSGSTINEEINRSIALFEDDPDDVTRVVNMRQLLKTSEAKLEDVEDGDRAQTGTSPIEPERNKSPDINSVECSECGKTVSLDKFDEHSDYHLALKLREEMRQEVRREQNRTKSVLSETNKNSPNKKETPEKQCTRSDNVPSIVNFFTKFDRSIETKLCAECGKKVPINKLPEHLDFHEAQKLSREINNRSSVVNVTSAKRKRKSSSPVKKNKVPCKSIDLFFRQ
ncbi:DNA polymerase eta [Danaus plexippus]|uniref:DNA polymerase eta n=1 Tax=Danaus plexippus TaxID=13037 RepID=UPI002AB29458|nr:DNA polymerase eta [Danaus plexippus]